MQPEPKSIRCLLRMVRTLFMQAMKTATLTCLCSESAARMHIRSLPTQLPTRLSLPIHRMAGIAFRSTRQPAGIYVMERTGENVRLVADNCRHPSWSPEGTRSFVAPTVATHLRPGILVPARCGSSTSKQEASGCFVKMMPCSRRGLLGIASRFGSCRRRRDEATSRRLPRRR